jgi:hypothetical protein
MGFGRRCVLGELEASYGVGRTAGNCPLAPNLSISLVEVSVGFVVSVLHSIAHWPALCRWLSAMIIAHDGCAHVLDATTQRVTLVSLSCIRTFCLSV